MFNQGSQLAQIQPSASASTAFTATLRTEVTRIMVCNVSGSGATFDIYHDDDGTTFDGTTALFWQANIPSNSTVEVLSETLGSGVMMARGGSIGVKASINQSLTFTLYGVTEAVI